MSAGIQHLLKGGRESNREARVDKIETDRFNSIVERISGVNPSKLAAEVSGKKMVEAPSVAPPTPPPQSSMASWGSGPAHQLAAQRPDAHVNFLAEKVAMLEHKLAKYETFNGADNDVVSTTNTPAKELSRGADSSAMGSKVIRKKNAKTKDPVDGKPDGPPTQKQPEAQMAGEHVNILGISMNEWREMTGLKSPPVDLTARPPVVESYEDEEDGEIEVDDAVNEHGLWAQFLSAYESTPEEFAAFVEEADEAGDEEALLAIGVLEDEFVEMMEGETENMQSQMAKLKMQRAQAAAASVRNKIAAVKSRGKDCPPVRESEDIDALWSQWLEERGLSVETFDALVEAIETDEDLETLEALQAMFEAELAEMKVGDTVPVDSILNAQTKIKPADNSASTAHPLIKKMAALRKMAQPKTEDDEAFECDDDGNGHPDMKHPGWAKAMKKFKKSGGKS